MNLSYFNYYNQLLLVLLLVCVFSVHWKTFQTFLCRLDLLLVDHLLCIRPPFFMQCATHKNLGWRIRVINEGDPIPAGATPTHTVTALSILLCVLLALFLAGAK